MFGENSVISRHIDQQNAAWFERDFCVSCASDITTQMAIHFFLPFCQQEFTNSSTWGNSQWAAGWITVNSKNTKSSSQHCPGLCCATNPMFRTVLGCFGQTSRRLVYKNGNSHNAHTMHCEIFMISYLCIPYGRLQTTHTSIPFKQTQNNMAWWMHVQVKRSAHSLMSSPSHVSPIYWNSVSFKDL